MTEEIKKAGFHPADTNGDGKVTPGEQEMYLEFKRKELENVILPIRYFDYIITRTRSGGKIDCRYRPNLLCRNFSIGCRLFWSECLR